jgi:hypothetical protein
LFLKANIVLNNIYVIKPPGLNSPGELQLAEILAHELIPGIVNVCDFKTGPFLKVCPSGMASIIPLKRYRVSGEMAPALCPYPPVAWNNHRLKIK